MKTVNSNAKIRNLSPITAQEHGFDASLVALFAASSGPIYRPKSPPRHAFSRSYSFDFTSTSDEGSESRSRLHNVQKDGTDPSSLRSENEEQSDRPRKRRRREEDDDLETAYFDRLRQEEASNARITKLEERREDTPPDTGNLPDSGDETFLKSKSPPPKSPNLDVPLHETLAFEEQDPQAKSDKTVFLGNVSTDAIKSRSARRSLLNHLSTALQDLSDDGSVHKIISLRFRSTAFVAGVGPKKAAFAKKELMDSTTRSTNAYVVYSSQAAAIISASKLNGTIVLGRHLRADYLGRPSKVDNRRCVFVGNLNFVDEETFEEPQEDDEKHRRRPKGREPADLEEGLWRVFSQAGKVDSVRVVRDRETRVGKGFAYVQFSDENAVEAALLMNGKKFPPMLPRTLRVVRARKVKLRNKDSDATTRTLQRTLDQRGRRSNSRKAETGSGRSWVFEGHRASKKVDGKSKRTKPKARSGSKPNNRSSHRAAAFRAAGGKRRDSDRVA